MWWSGISHTSFQWRWLRSQQRSPLACSYKGDDMVAIMTHLHQYVPTIDYSNQSTSKSSEYKPSDLVRFHRVILGGDQLTAARARSSQRHMANSPTPVERLEGFIAACEDWHSKASLLGVLWKLLYSVQSPSEHCTLYQLRNLIRRNVVNKPIDSFNACDDFFTTVLTSHIIAAAMKYLHIESPLQVPPNNVVTDAQDLWTLPEPDRRDILKEICLNIVDEFVDFQFLSPVRARRVDESGDNVEVYARDVLSMGLFFWEYSDSIREGDGERLLRCWKYMLPMFVNTGRRNYAIEALRLLYQYHYQLPPCQRTQLLYSRFVNVHGLPGRNIAADLHMEHLNAVAKGCIKGLGANKTEKAIQRSAKALGTIVPVLEQFDAENNVSRASGAHKRASDDTDLATLVSELQSNEVFHTIPGRKHASFPNPKNVLRAKTSDELKEWIIARLE